VEEESGFEQLGKKNPSPQLMILNSNKLKAKHNFEIVEEEDKQEKSYRLQMLLKAMIADAVSENNRELGNEIKEIVQKEMDYQFRMQEEREEERFYDEDVVILDDEDEKPRTRDEDEEDEEEDF
jgi:hypothetical protein